VGKIATDLQTRVSEMNRASAVRAARTAVTGAQNAGRMDSYVAAGKMGIRLKKEWLSTLDSRTRHSHAILDGEQADTDKMFSNGCRFPGDPQGRPEEVYNCRCTMIAAVEGVDTSDTLRRDKNGPVPDMTYAQWEASKRGYSAPPISNIRNTELVEWRKTLQNQENIDRLKSMIESGEISTKIRSQQQKKHIKGTPQFEQYRAARLEKGQTPQSILMVSEIEAQEIVDKYKATGTVDIKKTGKNSVKIVEYCNADGMVGQYYGDNEYHDTNRFGIFYSKRGTYIVPTPPEKEKRND